MIDLAAFVLGAALLYLGGDFLVRGASAVAERLGVRAVVTAATIVAFGASAPEFATTITAVSLGAPATALGVVSGATLASLLVLGLAAMIVPVPARVLGLSAITHFLLLAGTLLIWLGWVWILDQVGADEGAYWVRLLPVLVMLTTLGLLARDFVKAASTNSDDPLIEDAADIYTIERTPDRVGKVILFLTGGLLLLVLGSFLAVPAARSLSGDDSIAGVYLLGLAAILPELGAAMAAALTGRAKLILPSILGSAAMNVFGVGALLIALPSAVTVDPMSNDLRYGFIAVGLLLLRANQHEYFPNVGRLGGFIMLSFYAVFTSGIVFLR